MLWPAAGQKIVHLGGGGPVQVAEACEDIFGVDFFLFPVSGDYLDLCLRFYMIFLKTRSQRINLPPRFVHSHPPLLGKGEVGVGAGWGDSLSPPIPLAAAPT